MMALLCMTATAMATDDQVWVLGAQVNDANTTDGFAGTGMLMLKKREQNEPNQTIVSSFGPPAF